MYKLLTALMGFCTAVSATGCLIGMLDGDLDHAQKSLLVVLLCSLLGMHFNSKAQ